MKLVVCLLAFCMLAIAAAATADFSDYQFLLFYNKAINT
jgi:hypothetical protein